MNGKVIYLKKVEREKINKKIEQEERINLGYIGFDISIYSNSSNITIVPDINLNTDHMQKNLFKSFCMLIKEQVPMVLKSKQIDLNQINEHRKLSRQTLIKEQAQINFGRIVFNLFIYSSKSHIFMTIYTNIKSDFISQNLFLSSFSFIEKEIPAILDQYIDICES